MALVHSQPCPCSSGRDLGVCCGPFISGKAEPPDAVALMRSRYSAYAVNEPAWLLRSLHRSHPDWKRPEADVLFALAKACRDYKYRGLWILDHASEPPKAQVLFQARLYEKGKDRSFVERSEFLHDGDGWRYLDGKMLPTAAIEGDVKLLRLQTFDLTRAI